MKKDELIREYTKCYLSIPYFIHKYCWIEDKQTGEWENFRLWPKQVEFAKKMQTERFIAALKARQVGFSWEAVARCLHKCIFTPGCLIGFWSRRDDESIELLRRFKEMHKRLPAWLAGNIIKDRSNGNNTHNYVLDNGSNAKAFPTTAGDSYTVAIALIDEADLMPDLNSLLRAVKPTIDAAGQLLLISRPNKDKPESTFKRIYRDALEGKNGYCPIFASWKDRPNRSEAWYNDQVRDSITRTGTMDDVYEQYPNNENEALAARVLNKRFPPEWVNQCLDVQSEVVYQITELREEIDEWGRNRKQVQYNIDIPGLKVYIRPEIGMRFALGADPAEGLKSSDDSAVIVLRDDGRHAASLHGKIEIGVFSENIRHIARFFNGAKVHVERNNHGHAVLGRISGTVNLLNGRDGRRGWLSDARGKTEMYANTADKLRDMQTTIADRETFNQLASIERSTLLASEGLPDDLADAYCLACLALNKIESNIGEVTYV